MGKDNCKTRRETFEFTYLVWLILEILRYIYELHLKTKSRDISSTHNTHSSCQIYTSHRARRDNAMLYAKFQNNLIIGESVNELLWDFNKQGFVRFESEISLLVPFQTSTAAPLKL